MLALMTQFAVTVGTIILDGNSINNNRHYSYTYKNGTILHYSLFVDTYYTIDNIMLFSIAYFSASILVMLCISQCIYGNTTSMYITDTDTEGDESSDEGEDDDTDTDAEEDEEDEEDEEGDVDENDTSDDNEITYEQRHFDTLNNLPDTILTPQELGLLAKIPLVENTPKGIVIMFYNAETSSFEYYTDKHTDISYEILDTVARLFTIQFNCKQICVNYQREVENGKIKMLSEIEYDKLCKDKQEQNIKMREQGSVFASFKSYNKKTGNNVDKKYYIVTDNANRFKYKGKISDYEKFINKSKTDETTSCNKLSYAEYKRSLCADGHAKLE